MAPPGSLTLEQILLELQGMHADMNAKLDTLIAGQAGGVPAELAQIRDELTHLRYMFHIRQWETGAPLGLPFPDFPDRTDPVPY